MATRVASPEFVGRAAELAELEAALARARAGAPTVALIGGESGVGKSRLVAELIARALADGARVLTGDCVALGDTELPYAPIVGALRDLDRDEVEAVLGPSTAGLAPLLPQVGEVDPATSGTLAQGRLFELLLALIGGLSSADHPLLLVIEDLHWADRSTRDFLSFLIRTARRQQIMLVATYRSDELHRRHPLRPFLAEAERAPAVTRLALPRFTRDELRAQLEGILGRRPETQLVADLYTRAEGNPFYTEELLAAGDRLPENVRDTLMMRIEALSPDAQTALRMAAAAGSRVRHGLLVRALELPGDALLAALREAVVHHVLVHDPATDAYGFRHALQREAITDDLLPGERGPLHGSLARALTADPALSVSGGGVAAELAFHWAAAHNLPAAFSASCQAGEEAERLAAFAEANTHFERAAELFDAVPPEQRATSRVDLLLRAAESAYFAGGSDRAVALIRRALTEVGTEHDPTMAAILNERLGRYLWVNGLAIDALDACRTAVALLPADCPGAERARVLGAEGHLLMLVGRGVEASARCEEALPVARAAGARLEEARILNTFGGANALQGRYDAALECLHAARRIAEEMRYLEEMIRCYVNLGQTLDSSGRVEEAAEVAREGVAMCEREGIVGAGAILVSELSYRLLRLGRWEEASRLTDEILDRPLTGIHRASALSVRGHLDALRGDAEDAHRYLDEAERSQRQAAGAMWTAPVAIARAEAALWGNEPHEARQVIADELDSYGAQDDDPIFVPPVLTLGVRAEADVAARARAAGDGESERAAIERAAGLLRRTHCLLSVERDGGSADPETALHGAWAEAEAARAAGHSGASAWGELAGRWEAFGFPYPAAYARWRQAEVELAGGGERPHVQAALAAAHGAARELGARPLRTEVETLAQRARITLSAAPAAAAGTTAERIGLTDRELAVLHRLAAGESNREIGQSLYISHKTVSVHVSRILSKLDAKTRAEAASLAQRLGLLDEPAA